MKPKNKMFLVISMILAIAGFSSGQTATKKEVQNPNFDAELAARLGADKIGMKNYVLVILKTGPATVAAGKERDEIFKGHFANIHRLADEGKLVVAGPFGDQGVDWRGMFIFNVATVEEAQKLTATDPVIKSGIMVAEFHKLYCSAALMEVNNIHKKIASENF
jgi:uncharacterized protein YciI